MAVRIIGDDPLAPGDHVHAESRIATLFVGDRTLVTLPGIHATQRSAYFEVLNQERRSAGLPALSEEEIDALWPGSVDLVLDHGFFLIRPAPDGLENAFAADEILQELVSKRRIRYLNAVDGEVSQALRARGELWRIAPLPQSVPEMLRMIGRSRNRIARRPIYYYNMITGTRYLTCQELAGLERLGAAELAAQLQEIRDHATRRNARGCVEIDFFMTEGRFPAADLRELAFESMSPDRLRAEFQRLCAKMQEAVAPEFRSDNPADPVWRQAMFSTLVQRHDQTVSEAVLAGLSSEFYLQIRWLPGGRIENGELIFDPVFDECESHPEDEDLHILCDENARSFFFNSIREYGDIEYANIGRVVRSLSTRPASSGRRAVYISEVKLLGVESPVVKIIRLQKWGIREHLEEGKGLLQSIMEAEEYVQYSLDRRLGCRQLGMNLPSRISTHKLGERYHGPRRELEGQILWETYMERDYIGGMATDKVPLSRLRDPVFAVRFARLLGEAAAPNLIVGCLQADSRVLFDSGDEVLLLDAEGMPAGIVATENTGTFADYRHELFHFASGYAAVVNRRLPGLEAAGDFAQAFLEGFQTRFTQIREEFLRRRRAFYTLFRHGRYDQEGAFAYRWERVLERLERSDGGELAAAISLHLDPRARPD